MNRREFLRGAGLGGALLLGGGFLPAGRSSLMDSLLRGPALNGLPGARAQMGMPFEADAEILLKSVEKEVQVLPGAPTRVMGYEGQLLSGGGVTVDAIPGSSLGPILRVQSGTRLRIFHENHLYASNQPTVVHPHGLRVPEACDGQPMQAYLPGEGKMDEFEVVDPACPAWFHPHPMMLTAEQVAQGMAGLFYVTDAAEELAVPGAATGANDTRWCCRTAPSTAPTRFCTHPTTCGATWGIRSW